MLDLSHARREQVQVTHTIRAFMYFMLHMHGLLAYSDTPCAQSMMEGSGLTHKMLTIQRTTKGSIKWQAVQIGFIMRVIKHNHSLLIV